MVDFYVINFIKVNELGALAVKRKSLDFKNPFYRLPANIRKVESK